MMKKLVLIFTIAVLVSCKKEKDVISNNAPLAVVEAENQLTDIGDEMIGQEGFINKLNDATSLKEKRKVLREIKFDYDKYASWNDNSIEEKKKDKISLKLTKDNSGKNDADIYSHIKLTVEKGNKVTDTLTLYKQENYAEALVAVTQYFYIDAKLNIWTLAITEEEDNIYIQSWNQFKVDSNTGKITFVKKSFVNQAEPAQQTNLNANDWSGNYFFKRENRDELVTSFEINIKSLKAIDVIYVSDGEKPETYKNLIAELIDKDKIKIQFNKKYDELGSIYIQKEDGNYIISGEPISNINPGNEEYPIKKVK
ncbi:MULTISPECIES: hypothetical protein [unclassified Flavobacterium]|uniref:hypothetical protein n=1 Tax=unclassified Flavobacterium TaxID=196869 RepID=UPI0036110B15